MSVLWCNGKVTQMHAWSDSKGSRKVKKKYTNNLQKNVPDRLNNSWLCLLIL